MVIIIISTLFAFLSLVSANWRSEEKDLVLSLIDHNRIQNCILISDTIDYYFLKQLSGKSVFTIWSSTNREELLLKLDVWYIQDRKTLAVFFSPCSSKLVHILEEKVSSYFLVEVLLWVAFFESEKQFSSQLRFNDIGVRYDTEFFVIFPVNETGRSVLQIDEVYKKLPFNQNLTRLNYGFWSGKNKSLQVSSEEFYKRRINLEGMKIGLDIEDENFCWAQATCFHLEIWNGFSEVMNFRTETFTRKQRESLSPEEAFNIQGVLTPLPIYDKRFRLNFVGPTFYLKMRLFVKYQRVELTGLGSFFVPFSKNVWMCFIAYVILLFVVHLLVESSRRASNQSQKMDISSCIFTVLALLANQELIISEVDVLSNRVTIIGRFANFVIFSAYSGAIMSLLSLDIPLIPFRTLEEFIDNGQYLLSVDEGLFMENYFRKSSDKTLQRIAQEFMLPRELNISNDWSKSRAAVCEMDKTAVGAYDNEIYNIAKCRVQVIPQWSYDVATGMYLPGNMFYKTIFNRLFHRQLYSGIIEKMRTTVRGTPVSYEAEEYARFEVWQIFPVLLLMCFGFIVAPFVLCVEFCYKNRIRK